MDVISRESLINKLDPWYKKIKKTAPDNLAEGFMQVDGLIRHEPSAFEGMTYKDVVKAVFPNAVVIVNDLNGTVRVVFSDEVWDSPYQKGGEEE